MIGAEAGLLNFEGIAEQRFRRPVVRARAGADVLPADMRRAVFYCSSPVCGCYSEHRKGVGSQRSALRPGAHVSGIIAFRKGIGDRAKSAGPSGSRDVASRREPVAHHRLDEAVDSTAGDRLALLLHGDERDILERADGRLSALASMTLSVTTSRGMSSGARRKARMPISVSASRHFLAALSIARLKVAWTALG